VASVLAIARELAAHGGSVAVADIAGERADAAAASIVARWRQGRRCRRRRARRGRAVEALFGKVEAELGAVDILVNNAGISIDRGVRRITDEDWQPDRSR
jgi:3-oxoacyl-[acyl-carrier protein] reductase